MIMLMLTSCWRSCSSWQTLGRSGVIVAENVIGDTPAFPTVLTGFPFLIGLQCPNILEIDHSVKNNSTDSILTATYNPRF